MQWGSCASVREGGACDGLKFQLPCASGLFWLRASSGALLPPFAPRFSAELGSAVGGGKAIWVCPEEGFLHSVEAPSTTFSIPASSEAAGGGGLSEPQWG